MQNAPAGSGVHSDSYPTGSDVTPGWRLLLAFRAMVWLIPFWKSHDRLAAVYGSSIINNRHTI
jgi:hypothetical protein